MQENSDLSLISLVLEYGHDLRHLIAFGGVQGEARGRQLHKGEKYFNDQQCLN